MLRRARARSIATGIARSIATATIAATAVITVIGASGLPACGQGPCEELKAKVCEAVGQQSCKHIVDELNKTLPGSDEACERLLTTGTFMRGLKGTSGVAPLTARATGGDNRPDHGDDDHDNSHGDDEPGQPSGAH